jgi:glycosyltransferase involved in cell wall biosynthesis
VHNGESRLRGCVGEILELASELTPDFSVLIVDDGSTDDTFSAAEELSAQYPQVKVRRQRFRRGLGPTIEGVRGRIRSDVVIVHDGVSRIDPNQVRTLWRDHVGRQATKQSGQVVETGVGVLTAAAQTHTSLAKAHDRLLGFQLISSIPPDSVPLEEFSPITVRPRAMERPATRQGGVGEIPELPRPKFLAALARFAFGE